MCVVADLSKEELARTRFLSRIKSLIRVLIRRHSLNIKIGEEIGEGGIVGEDGINLLRN